MTIIKILVAVIIALLLGACSTNQSMQIADQATVNTTTIQSVRDILGSPSESKALPNGELLDVFVISERTVKRSGFRSINDDKRSYPTDRRKDVLVGHFDSKTPKHVTSTCIVEATYGMDGIIQSFNAKPSRCTSLQHIAVEAKT